MFYTNIKDWLDAPWLEELTDLMEDNRRQTLLHPECLSLTTVATAKGNRYHFVNTDRLLAGDYSEQEEHIQTLVDAGDIQVTMMSTVFYPGSPDVQMKPDMAVGYFNQRLLSLHPKNGMAVVPGWGGPDEQGGDRIILSPLKAVTPPIRK